MQSFFHAQSSVFNASQELDALFAASNEEIEAVVRIPKEKRTFTNTVHHLADAQGELYNKSKTYIFPHLVGNSKELRDAASEAKKLFEGYEIEYFQRKDIYDALVEFKSLNLHLAEDEQRLLNKLLTDFERNGLSLSESKRAELAHILKDLNDLCTKFNRNVNETNPSLSFTRSELEGLTDDYLQSLKRDESQPQNYLVSLKYPELVPLMQRAKVEETRRKMEFLNNTKCMDVNPQILESVLVLRQRAAELLGYKNDAHFQLVLKMAKDTDTVFRFLTEISAKLEALAKSEYSKMLALKKEEYAGKDFDGKLNAWDLRYYENKLLERDYQVDDVEIQQYFPLPVVLRGVTSIYQRLLGVHFEQLHEAPTWHPDVQVFRVNDVASGNLLGFFYLDLFPRDGKYSHAACFPLHLAYTSRNGKHHYTEASLVCNFTKPLPDKPSLLRFSEVKTFFHEFGHLMHSILSKNRFSRLNWTWSAVEQDFLEVPSMMFENWVYEPEVLREISSRHFAGNGVAAGSPLPEEQLQRLVRARNATAGINYRRLCAMSLVDITLHSKLEAKSDIPGLYRRLMKEAMFIEATPGTNAVASWMHLTTGYNAGYYGYMWSQVYAADMFTRFQEQGVFNKQVGAELREAVLAPVALHDGVDMLVNFLGRKPNPDSFLISVGAKKKE